MFLSEECFWCFFSFAAQVPGRKGKAAVPFLYLGFGPCGASAESGRPGLDVGEKPKTGAGNAEDADEGDEVCVHVF